MPLKSGYKLESNTCVVNFYQTCETCSEYSENEFDKKWKMHFL